jgi:MoaA/NifB/PqqE/SkfB family radical SAM enzyme
VLLFQEITDLAQQNNISRWWWWGCFNGRGRGGFTHGVDDFHQNKHPEHEEEEADQGVDEEAIAKNRITVFCHIRQARERCLGIDGGFDDLDALGRKREVEVFKVCFADAEGDDRHDDVFDHGVYDRAEGAADNDPDGEVEGVTFGDELFKFSNDFHRVWVVVSRGLLETLFT